MTKADLKQRWGKYTDTDKLVDDIRALLRQCNFRNSEHGVCTMLDTYFTNKEPLIKLFQKSKNYAGDMRIVTEEEFERANCKQDVYNVVSWFSNSVGADKMVKKKEDECGKTLGDYLCTGVTYVKATDLENKNTLKKFAKVKENLDKFNWQGYTNESCDRWTTYCNLTYIFQDIYNSNLTAAQVTKLLAKDSTLKVAEGMKTSRAFNHFCNVYGVDKAEMYNKEFAKYADLVSGLKRKLKFVMSLNPYDYLTMSFGNSWTSCHNIQNHGGWCGGTLSYMLDHTSIITYCVGKDDDVQKDSKVYRNMFAYGENMLLQSRVYPQGNDGNTDLYAVFRKLVQTELTGLLGLKDDRWHSYIGNSYCCDATTSLGVHYKDYRANRNANISVPFEKSAEANLHDGSLVVGHRGICAHCGRYIDLNGRVSHSDCSIHNDNEDWLEDL